MPEENAVPARLRKIEGVAMMITRKRAIDRIRRSVAPVVVVVVVVVVVPAINRGCDYIMRKYVNLMSSSTTLSAKHRIQNSAV